MARDVLFREQYGIYGEEAVYIKPPGEEIVVRLGPVGTFHRSIYEALREVFLPQGYPESVSADYRNYQIWDTVQAFCSTISGALTTQAVMKGVGVGDSVATPVSAAITWILKDGSGMTGRIAFAWWKGTYLDADCKKWRLFADVLNDIAMFIELLLPFFMRYSMAVLCVSTSMKALVGVAGGATRAAITQHQAIRGNMADVSAKDGSQETFVNLTASLIGILILAWSTKGVVMWSFFIILTILHIYANYKAVKCLRLKTLNSGRMTLLLRSYLTHESVLPPGFVNDNESVCLGRGLNDRELCGFEIVLGASLRSVFVSGIVSPRDMRKLCDLYQRRKYFLVVDLQKRRIYAAFQKGVVASDVIEAYYHATLLGISSSTYLNIPIPILAESAVHRNSLCVRLRALILELCKGKGRDFCVPLEVHSKVDHIASTEFFRFLSDLREKGWSVTSHQLLVDEWRSEWRPHRD